MLRERQRTTGLPGALRAWAAWWVVLAALYLALVDTVKVAELVTGAVAAAIAATGAVLVRRERDVLLRPRARWLLAAWRPLVSSVTDLVPLVRALWSRGILRREEQGALVRLPYAAVGQDPEQAAHRVLTQALGSLAPNTIVVGVDKRTRELLAHELVPTDDPGAAALPLPPPP